MSKRTTRNNARKRAQRTNAQQVVIRPMSSTADSTTLRIKTRFVYELGYAATANLYFSAGQINGGVSQSTSGVEQFDAKAYKFFGIYRYWRLTGLRVSIVNNTNATSNTTVYVGWAPGETGTYSVADIMDNDSCVGVTAGQGSAVMTVPLKHLLPNNMWRRTRAQSDVTVGGLHMIYPSMEEVTQGVLTFLTNTTGTGTSAVITVEPSWEFKEYA